MKNHRFLWLRNRTTDNRKCEKARNIKEKRTIEMFNTVSKQLVALHSSQRDNSTEYRKRANFPESIEFSGISLLGQGPVSRMEFFVFRKMECWKQINHLLCEWLEIL